MGRLWIRFVMATMMVLPMCVNAQDNALPVLTLEDAIQIALVNNFDIQLAENDSALLALNYQYRNVVFLPRLNGTVSTAWTNNNQNQRFANGTERGGNVASNNINASLALNWTLFDGLRMFATREKAEEFVRLGEITVKTQVVNTVANVVSTYYNIVRQKQQLRAVEEQMRLSQTRVDLAQRKLEIGIGAKPDVLQSQVDHNAQRAAQLQQETFIRQLKENLNQLLNDGTTPTYRVGSTAYDVEETIPLQLGLSLDELRANIERSNPDLLFQAKNIDIAQLTLKEIKADRFPTIQFNAAYNFARTNNDIAVNPALPVFNRNRGLNYGFTATIPILNYRDNHRQTQQALLDIKYQELLYQNRLAAINRDQLNAFREYELQLKALELEESNIALALENVNIIQETYRLGGATFIQLREAEKSLEDAYNRLIAARYNTKLAEIELLRLRGEIVR